MHRAVRAAAWALFWQSIMAVILVWPGSPMRLGALLGVVVGIGMIVQGRFLRVARRAFIETNVPAPTWLPLATGWAFAAGFAAVAMRMVP